MKKLALLLALASAAAAQTVTVAPYYPLRTGSKFVYVDQASNEGFSLAINDQAAVVNGSSAFKWARIGKDYFDQVSNDAQGIRLHARKDGTGLVNYRPPVMFCEANATVGKILITVPDYHNPATGNTTTWTAKVGAVEDCQVPAGTFKGCVRIDLAIKDTVLGTNLARIQMWLAKDVGMVKRVGTFFGVFYNEVLTSYTLAH